jgi:hypothetical protein
MESQMRNERGAISTARRSKILGGRFSVLVLAGALIACGKSSSSSKPGPGAPTLSSISLTPATITIPTGAQQQLAVIGAYSDSTTAPITSGIEWSSSSPSVAGIGASGLVSSTADTTSAGTTTITASVGGYSAQASVTVTPAALLSVTIDPPTASIHVSEVQAFTAIGHYSNNTSAPLVNLNWSSSDETIAKLDGSFAEGVKSGGPVTITAMDPASQKSSTASLTIKDPELLSLAVSPSEASLPVGFSRQLTAIAQFTGGKTKEISVDWSSSNSAVAAVDHSSGLVSGVALGGPVTITATHHDSGKTSTAAISVTAPVAVTELIPSDLPKSFGPFLASGGNPYKITTLDPAAEVLVRVTSSDPTSAARRPTVEVYPDASFTGSWTCSSWAGGPPCRAGVPNAAGELFILVTINGTPATFTLDVKPLPVLQAGVTVGHAVDGTETYYKVEGLTVPGTVQHTFSPDDKFADLFSYDGPSGPYGFVKILNPVTQVWTAVPSPGFGLLCNTAAWSPLQPPAQEVAAVKGCFVANPLAPGATLAAAPATGAAYLTVEGWLTGAGTSFSLTP